VIHEMRSADRAYWLYEERPMAWTYEPAPVTEDFWDHADFQCSGCQIVVRKRLNYVQKVSGWMRSRSMGREGLLSFLSRVGVTEDEWRELKWYAVASRAEGTEPDPFLTDEQIHAVAKEMGVTTGWLLDDHTTWPPDYRPPSLGPAPEAPEAPSP